MIKAKISFSNRRSHFRGPPRGEMGWASLSKIVHFIRETSNLFVGNNVIQLDYIPGASTRTTVRGFFAVEVCTWSLVRSPTSLVSGAKVRQTSSMTHYLREILRRWVSYSGVIRVQHTPPHHTMNCLVHSRLRPHRPRRFLQVHQLGKDDRILA